MKVILIPGFWLDASSWNPVSTALRDAGHDVLALTMPGMQSADEDRGGISLQTYVDAVVAAIDDSDDEQVVLVGHSAGGSHAHLAVDARPDRVARVVYVDSWPPAPGNPTNDGLPVVGDSVPLPDWSAFDDSDLTDLTPDLREEFRARAVPVPARVARDLIELTNSARHDVPITVITCAMSSGELKQAQHPEHPWSAYLTELAASTDVTYVDLPTGHWPQFTKPRKLASAVVAAIA